jgi:hypothetical protein
MFATLCRLWRKWSAGGQSSRAPLGRRSGQPWLLGAEPLEDRLLLSGNDGGAVRRLIADLRSDLLGSADPTPIDSLPSVSGAYIIQMVKDVRSPGVALRPPALDAWLPLLGEAQGGGQRSSSDGALVKGPMVELAAPFLRDPAGLPEALTASKTDPVAVPPLLVQEAGHALQLAAAVLTTDGDVVVGKLTGHEVRELLGSFLERTQSYRSEVVALAFRQRSGPPDPAAAEVDTLSQGREATGLPYGANSDTGFPAFLLGKPDGTGIALILANGGEGDPSAGTWVGLDGGGFAIVQPADARDPYLLVSVDLGLPAPQVDLVPLHDAHPAVVATYLMGDTANAGLTDPVIEAAAPAVVNFVVGLDSVPGGTTPGPGAGRDFSPYRPLSLAQSRQVLDQLFSQQPPGGRGSAGTTDLAGRQPAEELFEVECCLESEAAAGEPARGPGQHENEEVAPRLRFWLAGLCAFGMWQSLGRFARVNRRLPRPGLRKPLH